MAARNTLCRLMGIPSQPNGIAASTSSHWERSRHAISGGGGGLQSAAGGAALQHPAAGGGVQQPPPPPAYAPAGGASAAAGGAAVSAGGPQQAGGGAAPQHLLFAAPLSGGGGPRWQPPFPWAADPSQSQGILTPQRMASLALLASVQLAASSHHNAEAELTTLLSPVEFQALRTGLQAAGRSFKDLVKTRGNVVSSPTDRPGRRQQRQLCQLRSGYFQFLG